MRTYVLHERWPDGDEDYILGVYSTPEKALEKMGGYYGDYALIEDHVMDHDDIHFSKTIVAKNHHNKDMVLVITLMIFQLDET